MNSRLTDITVVMDRSGSMSVCQQEAENGLNAFIDKQKYGPGDALFTLVQFDTEIETVHRAKPIKEVSRCFLQPRGMTALLDAVGRAINDTGARLKNMPEYERPGFVVFVIITDGQENSSHEFSKSKIKEMITHQQEKYLWQFVFLGANQDAFAEAGGLGINLSNVANYNAAKSDQAYAATADNVLRGRVHTCSVGIAPTSSNFTDDEKKAMN